MVAHMDMDAFFASCEQKDKPSLVGRPVAVVAGPNSQAITAASYEARQLGAVVGKHYQHPDIHYIFANHHKYQSISNRIMACLTTHISPDIEIFSIDEAFIDLTQSKHIYTNELEMINHIQSCIFQETGLTCSIGLAENKALAKVASKVNKPQGYFIIPPGEGKAYLYNKPIDTICGIGAKMKLLLNQYGVYYCGDISKIPVSVLSAKFGQIGRQIWWMCQGVGATEVNTKQAPKKSMGRSKCIAWKTYSQNTINAYFSLLAFSLAQKIRSNSVKAQKYKISVYTDQERITVLLSTTTPTDQHIDIYELCKNFTDLIPWPNHIRKIGILAIDPGKSCQLDILNPQKKSHDKVIDQINQKFGNDTIGLANVIE